MKKLLPDTIAYCGLPCDSCPIRHSDVADLASQLADSLSQDSWKQLCIGLSAIEKHFSALQEYGEILNSLKLLGEIECQHPCKKGGGSTDCKIRQCCLEKELEGCWVCAEFESCEKLNWLQPVNGDAPRRNMMCILGSRDDPSFQNKLKWFA